MTPVRRIMSVEAAGMYVAVGVQKPARLLAVGVQEAAQALATACRSASLDAAFSPVAGPDLTAEEQRLSLSPELQAWYGAMAPRDVAIPFDVTELTLFDPADLARRQSGYRHSADTGEPLPDWPCSWLVIGTMGGAPVVAHTDRPGTPVSRVERGAGWLMPYILAPGLSSYLAALAVWARVVADEYQGRIRTNDWRCQVLPEARWDLEQRLAPVLAAPYRQRWLPQE